MSQIDTVYIVLAVVLAVPVLLFIIGNIKTSRPDGTLVANVHKYRTMLFHIMPTRNESVVYFEEYVDAENLLQYAKDATEKLDMDVHVTHVVVAGAAVGFGENPTMNRFVSGFRLYDRKGLWMAFSMKRKRLDKEAKLSVVKQEIPGDMTFRDLCEGVDDKINVERSGKKTYADKEYDLFTMIPRPVFMRLQNFFRQLNYWNLLPGSFITPDPMHASIFIANLGSVKMGAGFHHLYEWGTCSLFVMVGKIEDRPVVRDGEVVVRPMLHLRFSYDERIDDGLSAGDGIKTMKEALENPHQVLGCLESDGSDAWPLTQPRDQRLPSTS